MHQAGARNQVGGDSQAVHGHRARSVENPEVALCREKYLLKAPVHPYAVRESWNVTRRQDGDQAFQDERSDHPDGRRRQEVWFGDVPTLIATGPSKETPKLPEEEDIKKEVWSQLGRMEKATRKTKLV